MKQNKFFESIDESLFDSLPLNYKLVHLRGNSNVGAICKFIVSELHQTKKHLIMWHHKPISKIFTLPEMIQPKQINHE